jgi:thioredoxin reductase (NADPH)
VPGFPRLKESYDFVILGGGHAGLQAGLKAALLNHTAAVVDRGPKYSRSYYAPKMDNIPGFPDGISGHKLLDQQIAALRTVEQKVGYFTPARATAARRTEQGWEVSFEWLKQSQVARGRALILAMGVVDRIPVVDGKIDPIFPWANFGIVDFCIFCDGHTMPGKSVAVLGHDTYAALTALDLLHFEPRSVEILTNGVPLLADRDAPERTALEERLARAGITSITQAIAGFDGIRQKEFHVKFADGAIRQYDKGFSALGWYEMNQQIPRSLGCAFDSEGYVITDEDCRALEAETRAPIPGLYCVGDLRNGWNQIPEAWATAERAVIHAYGSFL